MLSPVEWLNKENLKHTPLASVKLSSRAFTLCHSHFSIWLPVWNVLPSLCLCSLIHPSWNLTLLGIRVSCIIRIMLYVWTLKTSKTVPKHVMGIQLMVLPLATLSVSIGTVNFLLKKKKSAVDLVQGWAYWAAQQMPFLSPYLQGLTWLCHAPLFQGSFAPELGQLLVSLSYSSHSTSAGSTYVSYPINRYNS